MMALACERRIDLLRSPSTRVYELTASSKKHTLQNGDLI